MRPTLVIGEMQTGRKTFIRNMLEGVEGVFWVAAGGFPPDGLKGVSAFSPAQLNAVAANKELRASKVIVVDNLSSVLGIYLTALVTGEVPQQKDWGNAGYSTYKFMLSLAATGLEYHALMGVREVKEGQVITKEIQLTPMALSYVRPMFPEVRFCYTKVSDGATQYLVQENTELAYNLRKGKK